MNLSLPEQQVEVLATELKNRIISYLLKTHNISWLNDNVETEMYDLVFSFIDVYLIKKILGVEP